MATERRSWRITMPMILRMARLRQAGLSYPAIAAVIELDYGVALTGDAVRWRLGRYTDPPAPVRHVRTATVGNGANFPPACGGGTG